VQVREEFDKLAHGTRISSVPIYGGKPIRGQIAKLQRGADAVIGTPGRVIDLIGRGSSICVQFKLSCWTKPIECSISASDPISKKSSAAAPRIDRRCCSAPPSPRRSSAWPNLHARPTGNGFLADKNKGRDDRAVLFHSRHERKFELLVQLLKRDKPRASRLFSVEQNAGTEKHSSPAFEDLSRRRLMTAIWCKAPATV